MFEHEACSVAHEPSSVVTPSSRRPTPAPRPASPGDPDQVHQRRRPSLDLASYRAPPLAAPTINRLKQYRCVATRYDKLDLTTFAWVRFTAIVLWL
jgi:transposase